MNRRKETESGFTLIELIIIIVVLGVLAVAAVPIYHDMTTDAKVSAEKSVVGNVRSGLSLYYVNSTLGGGTPSYPDLLDAANDNTEASDAKPLFVNVIQGGVTEGWTKQNDTTYLGPAGNTYEYSNVAGTFLLKN